jgi:Tfp pilus assembly protein PilF
VRDALAELEKVLADLRGRGEGVVNLLKLRDRLQEDMAALSDEGLDLRAERTRLETIDNIIMRKASQIGFELRARGGLAGVRRQETPPEERWWWFVDLYEGQKQRKVALRTMIIVVSVIAVLLIGNALLTRFYGLSPTEREAHSHISQAEQALVRGNMDQAITEYERAIAVSPRNGGALAALGVLYEAKGRTEEAKKAYASAEANFPDRVSYLLALVTANQWAGRFEGALSAVNEALKLNPQSAQAYLMRGGIYEAQGKRGEALADYEQSSNLASAQKQDALYVMARTRMAMLLQAGPGLNTTR